MAYILEKPYTDIQRVNFIVEHNHQQGLRIEETEHYMFALEVWEIVVNEEVQKDPTYDDRHLAEVKALKLKEAETKCKEKRYSQTFTVTLQEQECEFDTTEQTQSDLLTAGMVTSTGATYDNWVTNNGITINLTAEDVQTIFANFFTLVSPLYSKQLYYVEQINACTTVEEIEAIVIDYDHLEPNDKEVEDLDTLVNEAKSILNQEEISDEEVARLKEIGIQLKIEGMASSRKSQTIIDKINTYIEEYENNSST